MADEKTKPEAAARKGGRGQAKAAVRKALQDLGPDAMPADIRKHIKSELRLNLPLKHISVYKSQINGETGTGAPGATAPPKGRRRKKQNKLEAVRQALAALGAGAKPLEIRDHIKKELGTSIAPALISNYKSLLSREATGQSRLFRAPARGATPGELSLEDIRVVKELAAKIGPERIHELVDVITR